MTTKGLRLGLGEGPDAEEETGELMAKGHSSAQSPLEDGNAASHASISRQTSSPRRTSL